MCVCVFFKKGYFDGFDIRRGVGFVDLGLLIGTLGSLVGT